MKSKSTFDVARERESLLQDTGGYEWAMRADHEWAKSVGGLGGTAHANLGMAIACLLVGFDAPAQQLLEKAISWLAEAIESNEKPQRYAEDGTEASRYTDFALCKWLLYDQHDDDSLRKFVYHEDRFLTSSGLSQDKAEVSLVLSGYVNARAYGRALDVFAGTPSLSPPSALSNIRGEAQMSYVICRHRLEMDYSDIEVDDATKTFLTRNMDKWLGNGHAVRAAEWMKIVCQSDNTSELSARETIMKCYDHLPGYDKIT